MDAPVRLDMEIAIELLPLVTKYNPYFIYLSRLDIKGKEGKEGTQGCLKVVSLSSVLGKRLFIVTTNVTKW